MIRISRSKIHPKIIFKVISKGNNVLIIGTNNYDIMEVLKHKKAKVAQIDSNQSKDIMEKLENFSINQFDFVLLNLELSKLVNIKSLIALASEKGKIAIFRVRNSNSIARHLKNKEKEVLKSFKDNNINIIQKFYCRKNKIFNNIFAKFFSYYIVYITNKNDENLAFQEAFTTKFLKKFLSFLKSKEIVLTSEEK